MRKTPCPSGHFCDIPRKQCICMHFIDDRTEVGPRIKSRNVSSITQKLNAYHKDILASGKFLITCADTYLWFSRIQLQYADHDAPLTPGDGNYSDCATGAEVCFEHSDSKPPPHDRYSCGLPQSPGGEKSVVENWSNMGGAAGVAAPALVG